jgi:hypothetical protein
VSTALIGSVMYIPSGAITRLSEDEYSISPLDREYQLDKVEKDHFLADWSRCS